MVPFISSYFRNGMALFFVDDWHGKEGKGQKEREDENLKSGNPLLTSYIKDHRSSGTFQE